MGRILGWLALSSGLALPALPALAGQDVPSYATSAGNESIHGVISALPGRFSLTLDDTRGFSDSVTLHDGTLIEPDGVALQVGQEVTIIGRTDGKTFDANEIDTDGADTSPSYDQAPQGDASLGSSDTGYGGYGGYGGGAYPYPPYVLPLGGNGYYYGGGYGGGYYYNTGGHGGSNHHGAAPGYAPNPVVHGVPVVRGQVPPVVTPIVRGHGGALPVRSGYAPPSAAGWRSAGTSVTLPTVVHPAAAAPAYRAAPAVHSAPATGYRGR